MIQQKAKPILCGDWLRVIDMDLFQKCNFISHAGLQLNWKIEMDALSDAEWDTCATMIMEYQKRPFYKAEGIPRGGVKLANALNKYASGDPIDQVLICDDVYTTGASFREYISDKYPMWTMGQGYRWVVFARKPSYEKDFVKALFTMPERSNRD